eukprot:c14564_g1_i1 orf=76-1050(+)
MASRAPFSQATRTSMGSFQLSQPPSAQHQRSRWSGWTPKERLQALKAMQDRNTENLLSAQEFFESFLRSRQLKSDFVSKASDVLWKREIVDVDEEKLNEVRTRLAELQKLSEEDDSGGYLKLSQARQWGLGGDGAPNNAKLETIDMQTFGDDRRRSGLLEYEALKRELTLLTATIAAFCSLYCGLVFSFEASVSYAIGSLASFLYLQLLFRHVDQFSEENVAAVFLRRRQKKIGIRSSDLQDSFEKAFFGSSFALSSPRLVIPVSIYGLWTLVHRLGDMPLDLQITPMMFGFFAYKAALLVQAVRENKDLAMSFEKETKNRLGG